MSEENEEFEYYSDMLPQNAYPTTGVRILTYLNEDGSTGFRFSQVGEGAVSDLIGVLEMIKYDITSTAVTLSKQRAREKRDE